MIAPGQHQTEHRTGARTDEEQPAALRFGQGPGQCEPDPPPARSGVATSEDGLYVRGDARTVIAHLDEEPAREGSRHDPDGAGTMDDRVVDEHLEDLANRGGGDGDLGQR